MLVQNQGTTRSYERGEDASLIPFYVRITIGRFSENAQEIKPEYF
jgi:hypothetical protein